MKRITITVFALAFTVLGAWAQGTDALPFTRIDQNPVSLGLAGAGSASNATAAYSAFSNASMLPFFEGRLDASAAFQLWSPSAAKSSNIAVGVAYKFSERVGVSLGYNLQSGAPYEVEDYNGQITGTFGPKSHVIALGAGFGIGEHFGIGVNARFAAQKPSSDLSYNGLSADLFVAYAVNNDLRFTAGVSTLGTSITAYNKKKYSQPASVKFGANWGISFAEVNRVEVMADFDYYFSKNVSAAIGAQYDWNKTAFVRLGYRYSTPYCVIPSHLAIGIGGKFHGFRLDLSYLTASPALGNTLAIGLGYSF